jgi:hypothetical protein
MALYPTRREILLGASITLGGTLSGCLSGTKSARSTDSQSETSSPKPTTTATRPPAGTYADAPDGPEPYPSRPGDVNPGAATEYARQFEHARTTNVLYDTDVEDLHVDCRAVYDTAAPHGHYVLATCTGYANYADDVHADWGQQPALYFVGSDVTIRAGSYESEYSDCEDVFASSNPAENFAERCSGQSASYRASNVSQSQHSLTVTVEFRSETGTVPVLERTYSLDATTGVRQESVTYRRGTYRLTAVLENGSTATFDWQIRSEPVWDDPPVTVLVTPTADVVIRRVPFHEL